MVWLKNNECTASYVLFDIMKFMHLRTIISSIISLSHFSRERRWKLRCWNWVAAYVGSILRHKSVRRLKVGSVIIAFRMFSFGQILKNSYRALISLRAELKSSGRAAISAWRPSRTVIRELICFWLRWITARDRFRRCVCVITIRRDAGIWCAIQQRSRGSAWM